MSGKAASAITLRALEGQPLKDQRICQMVVATAHAIAERQGVKVLDVRTAPEEITVHLQTGRIEAIGFAVELRRLTTSWYTQKYGEKTLWGEADEDDDKWKQGD